MTRADIELIQFLISQELQRLSIPIGKDAVTISGSYDATDGTAQAIHGDTAAIIGDEGDQPILQDRIPIATTQLGDQYGAVGNERCVIIPTQSGGIKVFIHGPDDSPQVPSGQRWFTKIKTYKFITPGGFEFLLDETGQKIVLKTAGGLSITLDDGNGTLTLGSGDDPGSSDAIMRETDVHNALSTFAANIKNWAGTQFQSGTCTPTNAPTVPTITGSSIVQSS